MGSRAVEAEYEKGMLKPSPPLALRPGERVHLIVMRQPDAKRTVTSDEWRVTSRGPEPRGR